MEYSHCTFCQKPKAQFNCGVCLVTLCKKCIQFVPENSFLFLPTIPDVLSHATYCAPCYEDNVSQALQTYNEDMERARDVFVFYKTQNKETRAIKRKAEPIQVSKCDDKDETLLRLAFLAVKANFNTLIDVVISSEKIITNGYQKSEWRGVGSPVQLDPQHPILRKPEST